MRHAVLVVDDETDLADFMGDILEAHGYSAQVCYHGSDALRRLTEHRFDCIITDIRMPDLDGYQLCARIRQIHADLPVLTTSGDDVREGLIEEFRVSAHLAKPFSMARLLEAVAAAIGQGKSVR